MTPPDEKATPVPRDELMELLRQGCEEAAKVPPATTLYMNHDGKCVELYVDSKASDYSEWIRGEGADIGLMRERDTNRVVGVRLPMYYPLLIVDGDPELTRLRAVEAAAREWNDARLEHRKRCTVDTHERQWYALKALETALAAQAGGEGWC